MIRAPESPWAAAVRLPSLVAAATSLLVLLLSTSTHAASRGSAQNPIPLPGIETATQRHIAPRQPDRATRHRGAFEATLYGVPSASLLRGLRPRLTHDASVLDAVVRGQLDAASTADYDLGTAGLRLSIDPTWGVAIEGHDIAQGEFASPATFLRTRASFAMTQVGLEVSF